MLSRGAGQDGVLDGFRLQAAAGAGGVGIRGPPGWVGGQVTFSGSHLVYSPGDELPISWSLFYFFISFFVIKSLLCLKVQKTHAALAMEIKNL